MEWTILERKTPWPLVNVEEQDGELVVRFHEEAFLWPAVEEVGRILLSLVDETEGSPFILDLDNVEHVSGIGLENLARLHRKLAMQGGKLAVRNAALPLRLRLSGTKGADADDDMPVGISWHGRDCPEIRTNRLSLPD